jgi:hypothetical protein
VVHRITPGWRNVRLNSLDACPSVQEANSSTSWPNLDNPILRRIAQTRAFQRAPCGRCGHSPRGRQCINKRSVGRSSLARNRGCQYGSRISCCELGEGAWRG